MSEVCHLFEPVPQLLKNVKYKAGKPLDDQNVRAAIADATSRLGNHGRLVIRPSGTEPLIRVMAEGDDAGAGADSCRRHSAADFKGCSVGQRPISHFDVNG